MSYAIVRTDRLSLEEFAVLSGLHPDLIRRLVALGLIEAHRDTAGALWFSRSQIAAVARVQRLRAGFALNYAAIGLVTDLLDRIAVLEAPYGASAEEDEHGCSHLTQKSAEALHDAQTKALRFGHTEVDGEHLLLALLDQAEGIAPR